MPGTGFPKVFYLKYDMYRNAWPLLALATYKKILDRASATQNGHTNGHANGHVNVKNGHANGQPRHADETVFAK